MAGFFGTSGSHNTKESERRVRIKGVAVGLIPVLVMAVILLGTSGDPIWLMAWIFLVIHGGATVFLSFTIDISLITERMRPGDGIKGWDRTLVRLLNISGLLILLIAGLDHRYNWYNFIPMSLQIPGLILFIIGYLILIYAAITNSFFSSVVRIQKERGHQVITCGPYKFIRHPGYLGITLCLIAEPLIFQSLLSGIPCIIAVWFMIIRTRHEDQTLIQELDGYSDYKKSVQFRLIPGVW